VSGILDSRHLLRALRGAPPRSLSRAAAPEPEAASTRADAHVEEAV
jgi:hypothetical protein